MIRLHKGGADSRQNAFSDEHTLWVRFPSPDQYGTSDNGFRPITKRNIAAESLPRFNRATFLPDAWPSGFFRLLNPAFRGRCRSILAIAAQI